MQLCTYVNLRKGMGLVLYLNFICMYICTYVQYVCLYIFICVYRINLVKILPRQQWMLHGTTPPLGPEQSFPPQEGAGLLHILVRSCVPPPQLLLHGP